MNFKNISTSRKMLMGIAMIMIMIFHTTIRLPHTLDLVKNFGDFGVNIFFLISGFSMYYAWKKEPDIRKFYVKRFSRIMITYLPIAVVWCSLSVLLHECSIMEAVCKILTIQFWINGNLLHWFISGLLVLYFVTPLCMKLYEKSKIFCVVIIVALCFMCIVLPIMGIVKDRLIFIYRIPTYFIGIYMGYASFNNHAVSKTEKWCIYILGITGIFLFACIGFDTLNYTWKYAIYLLLTPATVLWIAYLFCVCKQEVFVKILTFCGTITLETYLLHEKILKMENMIFERLQITLDSYNIIANLLGAAIAIIIAYVYNRTIDRIKNDRKK